MPWPPAHSDTRSLSAPSLPTAATAVAVGTRKTERRCYFEYVAALLLLVGVAAAIGAGRGLARSLLLHTHFHSLLGSNGLYPNDRLQIRERSKSGS